MAGRVVTQNMVVDQERGRVLSNGGAIARTFDVGLMPACSAPTGLTHSLGMPSPDYAALHPGLFSSPPFGRSGGCDSLLARKRTRSAEKLVHAIAVASIGRAGDERSK